MFIPARTALILNRFDSLIPIPNDILIILQIHVRHKHKLVI